MNTVQDIEREIEAMLPEQLDARLKADTEAGRFDERIRLRSCGGSVSLAG